MTPTALRQCLQRLASQILACSEEEKMVT
ncbi:hypothetical protein [Thermogemmatispora aurantia]